MIFLRIEIVYPMTLTFAILMLGIGFFGFFTQVFLTLGLQRETASRGSLGIYVQIIFAAIAERIIFHGSPSYLSVIGTIIILVCALYVAVSNHFYYNPFPNRGFISSLSKPQILIPDHQIEKRSASFRTILKTIRTLTRNGSAWYMA
jgi:drug/metabolite transporter (DMT)-like permease